MTQKEPMIGGMVRLPQSRRERVDELAARLAISHNGAMNMLVSIALDSLAGRGRAATTPAGPGPGWEDVPIPQLRGHGA